MPRFFIDIEAKFAQFQDSLDKIQRDTSKAARAMEADFGRVKRVLGTLGVGISAGAWAAEIIKSTKEAEQASNRLNAVLRATGGIAGLTRIELDEMAESISKATQFDDEGIRNAQAQLLKFDNINRDVFGRALTLSADLAAFMGTDLPDAVQTIGKALASPKDGIGALERQIGHLDPTIAKLIEKNVQQNRILEAQILILDLLQRKLGGTSDAMNKGLTKATQELTNAWNDLNKAMGGQGKSTVVSVLEAGTRELTRWKRIVEEGTWVDKLLGVAAALSPAARIHGLQQPDSTGVGTPVRGRILPPEIPGLSDIKEFERAHAAADVGFKFTPEEWAREQERRKQEEERLRREFLAEQEKISKQLVEGEEEMLEERREAWDAFNKYFAGVLQDEQHVMQVFDDGTFTFVQRVIPNLQKAQEIQTQNFKTAIENADLESERIEGLVYTWDQYGNRVQLLREDYEELQAQQQRGIDIGRELGLTFTSAFEDAIIKGSKFSEVLKAIEQDIARLIIRRSITEPAAKGIEGFFKAVFMQTFGGGSGGAGAGGGIETDFSGAFAVGGRPSVGDVALVGERGPELFIPDRPGTILPNGSMGGITINQAPITINGPGVTMTEVRQALAIQHKATIAAVNDLRKR